MSAHKSYTVAIAALLLAGATSIAVAQGFDPSVKNRGGFDPDMANRYPHFAGPIPGGHLTTRDVRLPSTGTRYAPRGANESWMERASQTWGGGM